MGLALSPGLSNSLAKPVGAMLAFSPFCTSETEVRVGTFGLFKVTELGQVAQLGSQLRNLSGCKAHVLYR